MERMEIKKGHVTPHVTAFTGGKIMGEMNLCRIERPASGLMAALSMLSEYPPGQNLPAAKFNDIRIVLEQCGGPNDDCHHCAHAAPCRAAYDELSNRVK